jgi:hypothetical protein
MLWVHVYFWVLNSFLQLPPKLINYTLKTEQSWVHYIHNIIIFNTGDMKWMGNI